MSVVLKTGGAAPLTMGRERGAVCRAVEEMAWPCECVRRKNIADNLRIKGTASLSICLPAVPVLARFVGNGFSGRIHVWRCSV